MKTMTEETTTAISDYFRTALLIDDRVEPDYAILEDLSNKVPNSESSSNEYLHKKRSEDISQEPQPGLVAPPAEDRIPVYPSDLVRSFLKKGVVCSVHEVRKSDSDLEDLALQGAKIADLLILDWLLFGDDSHTVGAIEAIAEKHKDRLTVIVVFTGTPRLEDIVERLEKAADFNKVDEEDYVLRRDHTIVLVFGKPDIQRTEDVAHRTADYQDLPKMIQDDLDKVFKGLMSEFAFKGINVIRESLPRVLATFSPDMDAAALIHRALLPEPDDVGSQLIRLLVSDFEQALTELQHVDDVWSTDYIRRFLSDSQSIVTAEPLAQKLKQFLPNESESEPQDLARDAVIRGLLKIGLSDRQISKTVPELIAAFFPKDSEHIQEAKKPNETFAALMDSSDFGDVPPKLELGVVVKEDKDEDESANFWLCIQPLCDSVRLQDSRAFPLIPLKKCAGKTGKPDAMIRDGDDFVAISFQQHPYKLKMPEFTPKQETGTVTATREPSKTGKPTNWQFKSKDGRVYRAVTRLRFEFAAKAVQDFASNASRVGVDTSEWLRRGGTY